MIQTLRGGKECHSQTFELGFDVVQRGMCCRPNNPIHRRWVPPEQQDITTVCQIAAEVNRYGEQRVYMVVIEDSGLYIQAFEFTADGTVTPLPFSASLSVSGLM